MANPVIAANKVAAQQRRILDTLSAQSAPKIIAYHGSPHDFDRFDFAGNMGKGEGVQAYGYGGYFAGNESVANAYRRNLTEQPGAGIVLYYDDAGNRLPTDLVYALEDDRFANRWGPAEAPRVAREIAQARRRKAREIRASGIDGYNPLWWEQSAKTLEEYADRGLRPAGRTYEVELGVPEEALLDWDAPMSRQPELVSDMVSDWVSGGSLGMVDQAGDGRRLWHHMKDGYGAKRAAGRLLEAGIPGIRYFDANSRAAAEGTRNYVMFPGTEDRIRILRKYGLLGPAAVGAAVGQDGQ